MMRPRPRVYASKLGSIKLVRARKTGALIYVQCGGNQSAVDEHGVSLDSYIHALYGLTIQAKAKSVLMVGCGGGTLATMLSRADVRMTVVDIDKAAFKLAKTHFGLPMSVRCHVGDGLRFVQKTRARFDAVVVDAFIGETIPPQFTGDAFCRALRRCVTRKSVVLINVCLDGKADQTAIQLARRFAKQNWRVRVIDQCGAQRNAIVMAGAVKTLKRPRLLMPPNMEAKRVARELRAMRFRRTGVTRAASSRTTAL
jgi:spermidine synthase